MEVNKGNYIDCQLINYLFYFQTTSKKSLYQCVDTGFILKYSNLYHSHKGIIIMTLLMF